MKTKKKLLLIIGIPFFIILSYISKSNRTEVSHSQLALSGSFFLPIDLVDFQMEVPCVEFKIEDEIIDAKIALGFNGSVALPKDFIRKLANKSILQEVLYSGISGESFHGSLYSLPKFQVGTLNFLNVETLEDKSLSRNMPSSESFIGKLGWNFFSRLNFFLDCNLWLMAFCDSLETLSKQGYPIESFIECPFKTERQFIEFEAITEDGSLICLLDTGSTNNLINSRFSEKALFQNFMIGNDDFGPIVFHSIDMPFEVDAIIGMEFLHSKKLFIDFPNRKIYLSN